MVLFSRAVDPHATFQLNETIEDSMSFDEMRAKMRSFEQSAKRMMGKMKVKVKKILVSREGFYAESDSVWASDYVDIESQARKAGFSVMNF